MEELHETGMNTTHPDFEVGSFRPEDAEGIVSLCRSVYGDRYPIQLFYDAEAICRANEEGRYRTIIARTASGEVIGMMNLFPSAPEPSVYETGAGLVHRDYRQLGINGALLQFLYEVYIPTQPEIEESFGEPVCNHLILQKCVLRLRHIVTAIEIALMPGEVYEKEGEGSGRVATLAVFRCYRPKPHRIFLPDVYERELESIYARIDDARDITRSQEKTPSGILTQLEIQYFDLAGVARAAVREIGPDFFQAIGRLEQEAKARNVVVIQISVNLTTPWVGTAVEELRACGYFFGGALLRWLDGDALMMQKLFCSPGFESIQLHSEVSKQLLEIITRDWEHATGVNSRQP